MNFWEKVKKDLKKGIEDIDWEKIRGEMQLGIKKGVKAVRKGTAAVKEKAEELTEEAKRQYMIFELKGKVHDWMAELGGKVYGLSLKTTNPMNDTTVKLIVGRIKKLEAQIARLEKKTQALSKKRIK
ncbi:MAG: hypothetical protein COZ31_09090 [Nitrospirae bacterium CG_4_10_14_3_um_filter_44_29]|nr:MAG: hypothetical protein COS28_04620 [Nitrospirae bacterium CG02_land_8_20_14_3_00_44_33]PIV67007.1 MAG: hypothetical protein COS10_03280 [Nitrospirae bacterium CG01_land_8_20_14_3_00_44_22]PIW88524.1 MAG: hypothetical protein COZ93_09985 [Nitrospirae bacterium CG_4_8_14_3_um_filter_44_28]PIX87686.1 MAG: hypothetical protein COZ31_09090 [Nitrospirae bacterium CG_4_10_14_3_um_filter_44_29]